MTRHQRFAAGVLAALVLMPILGGCSMSTTPSPAEASKSSASLEEKFTGLMPPFLTTLSDGAELGYQRVREESCLSHEVDDPQINTSWLGWAVGEVSDTAAANQSLDDLEMQLLDDGWEKKNEIEEPDTAVGGVRTLFFRKGDLGITSELHRSSGQETLDIKLTSRCVDQPVEHRMQRSVLDPGYGQGGQYYDDGA